MRCDGLQARYRLHHDWEGGGEKIQNSSCELKEVRKNMKEVRKNMKEIRKNKHPLGLPVCPSSDLCTHNRRESILYQ